MSSNLTLGYKHKNKTSRTAYILSIIFITTAIVITIFQYILFTNNYYTLPQGLSLANVPVENMSRENALNKLNIVYNRPINIYYGTSRFILDPKQIDFDILEEKMFSKLLLPHKPQRYWKFLNGYSQAPVPQNILLEATYSQKKLVLILQDVASRYDQPPSTPMTDPTYLMTIIKTPSSSLQINESINLISKALYRPDNRDVQLILSTNKSQSPNFGMLTKQLSNHLILNNFDGLVSLYIADLNNNKTLHHAWMAGQDIPINPDIAFSGMSIIKITLLIEFYKQISNGALPYEIDLVEKTITESSNWTSNKLIEWIGDLDPYLGLQRLNNSYASLGLENTFIGGLYDTIELPGYRITPANSRIDVNTNPDVYMQTTSSDIGNLLKGIYHCSKNNNGLIIDRLGETITQAECTDMLKILSKNQIGVLLEAGVPEGTQIAHKHGWADGEPIADAGIVFTPSGDYVIVIYIWTPEYTYWDENARILSNLNKAAYHHFNPIIQAR